LEQEIHMFKTLALAVLASIFLASSGHAVVGKNVQASVNTEEAAVRKFVLEEIERWNSNGPLVAEAYTADSDYVDVNGRWTKGLADRKNKSNSLRLKNSKITLIDLHIRFIRPDVAIVHQTHDMSGKRGPNGEEVSTERQLSTQVLVKERGKCVSKYYRAPCGAGVQIVAACRSIHVVQPNNGMQRTRKKRAPRSQSSARAAGFM
jgi:hypothetical protein